MCNDGKPLSLKLYLKCALRPCSDQYMLKQVQTTGPRIYITLHTHREIKALKLPWVSHTHTSMLSFFFY